MTVVTCPAMVFRAAANAASEERQHGPEAPPTEPTAASSSPATPTVLLDAARDVGGSQATNLPHDVPTDDYVVVSGGGVTNVVGAAGASAAAPVAEAAVGGEALSRPDLGEARGAEVAADEPVIERGMFRGRVKINVWHAPTHAWRVTEMWVKPDTTWNQVKAAVAIHHRRRGGPYAGAPACAMHRVVGRDDGLWYRWRDRIIDPPNTSAQESREDPHASAMWGEGGGRDGG